MKILKVGTRGSPLALIQANTVCEKLNDHNIETELVVIQTSGDKNQASPLADIGGKALFAKELQHALLTDEIDIAVHSLKDLEPTHPKGLQLLTTLERGHVGDIFIAKKGCAKKNMQKDGVPFILGTCSPRRQHFIQDLYPKATVVPLRGNVGTRLKKLAEGQMDATIMAASGLLRLGIKKELEKDYDLILLDQKTFTPASCQGIIGIEGKESLYDMMQCIGHAPTYAQSVLERYAVHCFQGTCHSAIGALAKINIKTFHLHIQYQSPETKEIVYCEVNGELRQYKQIIEDAFRNLHN